MIRGGAVLVCRTRGRLLVLSECESRVRGGRWWQMRDLVGWCQGLEVEAGGRQWQLIEMAGRRFGGRKNWVFLRVRRDLMLMLLVRVLKSVLLLRVLSNQQPHPFADSMYSSRRASTLPPSDPWFVVVGVCSEHRLVLQALPKPW